MRKIIILIQILLTMSVGAFASGTPEKTDANTPLRVAMELQYPPFEMQDKDGNPSGISPDFARALGAYLERPVDIQNTAWTGLIPALQTGKVDLVISSMSITEERKKVIDFSQPYGQQGLGLLIYKDSPVQSIDDFLNPENIITDAKQIIRLGVRSGTIAADFAKKHNLNAHPNIEVINQDTPSAQLLEVIQGKVDAVLYDPLTLYKNYQDNKNTTRINLQAVETPGYWGVAVKKGNTALLDKVNAFIEDYRAKGGFDTLAEKYLSEEKVFFEQNDTAFFFDIE